MGKVRIADRSQCPASMQMLPSKQSVSFSVSLSSMLAASRTVATKRFFAYRWEMPALFDAQH